MSASPKGGAFSTLCETSCLRMCFGRRAAGPLYNAIRAMPTVLELYEKLKPKLGEAEARSLLEFIESSVDQRAATKADLQRTESALREDLHVTARHSRNQTMMAFPIS